MKSVFGLLLLFTTRAVADFAYNPGITISADNWLMEAGKKLYGDIIIRALDKVDVPNITLPDGLPVTGSVQNNTYAIGNVTYD